MNQKIISAPSIRHDKLPYTWFNGSRISLEKGIERRSAGFSYHRLPLLHGILGHFGHIVFKMWCWQRRPEALKVEEAEEGLLRSETLHQALGSKPDQRERSRTLRLFWGWALQSAILACSLALFVLSRCGEPSEAACTRKMSSYCKLECPWVVLRKKCSWTLDFER